MNTIDIFQKNWAFTSSDSERNKIRTASFGPCYVMTFSAGKYAAMAHVDDNTKVESIGAIFEKFKENSVSLTEVKVVILGGWSQHVESKRWGDKIIKFIDKYELSSVSTKNMYLKKTLSLQTQFGITLNQVPIYYYFGAMVDAAEGKTFIIKNRLIDLDCEQARRTQEFAQQYGADLDVELDLTQVL